MREHGVNMPDPQFEGGGRVRMGGPGTDVNPESPRFREAQEACQDKLPGGPGRPGFSRAGGGEK